MPLPDPYQINIQRGLLADQRSQEAQRMDEMRRVAEFGAQSLEQFGQEGAIWAQRLRSDPRAAMAMAEQYGGFGDIERGLRNAAAAGQSAQALDRSMSGTNMTPDQMEILRQYGPQGLKQYMEVMSTNNAPAFEMDAAKAIRKDYTSRSGDFGTIRHFYDIAAANAAKAAEDPSNPGAVDFALVQAYGKMLDPKSVVRNEEGKFIAESQSSTVQDALNKFARLFSAAGTLNPTARRNLMRQIEATYQQAAKKQSSLLQEMEGELDRLGATGVLREFSMPIGLGLSETQLDIAPWENQIAPQAAPAASYGLGTRKTITDPDTGERITIEKVPGGWDPVED